MSKSIASIEIEGWKKRVVSRKSERDEVLVRKNIRYIEKSEKKWEGGIIQGKEEQFKERKQREKDKMNLDEKSRRGKNGKKDYSSSSKLLQ